jgi:hypothetical protein
MTHHEQNTAIGQMLEAIIENGLEGLEEAVSILLNEAMKVERSRALTTTDSGGSVPPSLRQLLMLPCRLLPTRTALLRHTQLP